MTAAGKHNAWPHATERRVGALRALGRYEESVALGRALAAYAEAEDFEPVNLLRIYVALSLSEAEAGSIDAASHNLACALRCADREGIRGVPLGIVHEAAARLAIRTRDVAALEAALKTCAAVLLAGGNPSLTAKYERLLREAQAAGLAWADDRTLPPVDPVRARLRSVKDSRERAAMVLELLVQKHGVAAGCLFTVTEVGAMLVARKGPVTVEEKLCSFVSDYLSAELSDTQMVTVTQQHERVAQRSAPVLFSDEQDAYLHLLLRGRRQAHTFVAGVALLRVDASRPVHVDQSHGDVLGQAMLDGDPLCGRREAV